MRFDALHQLQIQVTTEWNRLHAISFSNCIALRRNYRIQCAVASICSFSSVFRGRKITPWSMAPLYELYFLVYVYLSTINLENIYYFKITRFKLLGYTLHCQLLYRPITNKFVWNITCMKYYTRNIFATKTASLTAIVTGWVRYNWRCINCFASATIV